MAVVGTVAINLQARTGRFNKSLGGAQKRLKAFGSSVGGIAAKVAQFGLVAGGAGVAALTVLTKKSFDSIDSTAKLADQLGTTTQALQGLRHAADITGAGAGTMDKSLEKMNKVLGEAKQGIGTGKNALEALGMSVDAFAGKRPDEQFSMFADAISKMKDPTERAAIATQIFGRAGGKLLNTLDLGSKGLAEMQAEANALGIAFNRTDSAKIEAANDAWTRMEKLLQGVGNTIAIQVAPFIEALYTKIVETAKEGGGLGPKVAGALSLIGKWIGKLLGPIDLVIAAFHTVDSGWNKILENVANGVSIMKGAFLGLSGLIKTAFGVVVQAVAKTIAGLEFRIKKTFIEGQRVVKLITDAEAIKQTNAARKERDGRTKDLANYGGNLQASGVQDAAAAQKAFQAGISGSAGALFKQASEESALKAVQSYRKFESGSSAAAFEEFVAGIQEKSQKAAEAVAKNRADKVAAVGAAPQAAGITQAKTQTNVRGSFSAMGLQNARTVGVQEKQLKELKNLNKNMKDNTKVVADAGGLG